MINAFQVGAEAFMAWHEGHCAADIPKNPFPQGSKHHEEWEIGFSDAEEYFIHGQYQDEDDEDDEE